MSTTVVALICPLICNREETNDLLSATAAVDRARRAPPAYGFGQANTSLTSSHEEPRDGLFLVHRISRLVFGWPLALTLNLARLAFASSRACWAGQEPRGQVTAGCCQNRLQRSVASHWRRRLV